MNDAPHSPKTDSLARIIRMPEWDVAKRMGPPKPSDLVELPFPVMCVSGRWADAAGSMLLRPLASLNRVIVIVDQDSIYHSGEAFWPGEIDDGSGPIVIADPHAETVA